VLCFFVFVMCIVRDTGLSFNKFYYSGPEKIIFLGVSFVCLFVFCVFVFVVFVFCCAICSKCNVERYDTSDNSRFFGFSRRFFYIKT